MKYEALLFLVDGFEEIEAIAPLDILRRGGVSIASVSLMGKLDVMGSRNIKIQADMLFEEIETTSGMMLILPGGPGTASYKKHDSLLEMLKNHNAKGDHLAAICAAPTILGMLDLLRNKSAVCHPSKEDELKAAQLLKEDVFTDGNITTSRAAGTSVAFGLHLLGLLKGDAVKQEVAKAILFSS